MKLATVDDSHRIQIPDLKPGQVLAYQDNPDGTVTLTPVEPAAQERPYDPHMYDNYPQERIDLEQATAKWQTGPDRE